MSTTASDDITDGRLIDLPPEAGDITKPRFEPDANWLQKAEPLMQKAAMWRWFSTHFDDRETTTPHDRDGEYLYLHGGPYFVDEVIPARFEGLVPEPVIAELVERIQQEAGNEWAGRQLDRFGG